MAAVAEMWRAEEQWLRRGDSEWLGFMASSALATQVAEAMNESLARTQVGEPTRALVDLPMARDEEFRIACGCNTAGCTHEWGDAGFCRGDAPAWKEAAAE